MYTCVADGTHQTSTYLLLTIIAYHSVAPRLLSWHIRNLRHVYDSLLHVGVCCKFLASQLLLKASKEMEIIVPHIAIRNFRPFSSFFWKFMGYLPSIPDLSPLTSRRRFEISVYRIKVLKRNVAESFRSVYLLFLCTLFIIYFFFIFTV